MSDFNLQAAVALVADSVCKLRRTDIFRLLESFTGQQRTKLARYVKDNRPDLTAEVNDVLDELADGELADNPRPRGY